MTAIASPPDSDRAAGSTARPRGRGLAAFLGIDRHSLLPTLGCGLVVSLAILVPVVSYPSLVFSGPLEAYSGLGVGLGLISALVLTASLLIGGSIAGTVAVGQSEPAVVLGVVVAVMAGELHAAGVDDRLLPTVAAAIAMSTFAVGIVYFALGRLRLGNLIRFVPYPLIVGFIGGMGWLLIGGAVRVVSGLPLEIASLGELAAPAMLPHWLPALVAGFGLWLLQRYRPRALNVPLVAIGIVAAFWFAVLGSGTSPADLAAEGWMLSPVPPLGSWLPTHRYALAQQVDWAVLFAHWPQMLTLGTVSLMGVLMQASVIEIAARSDVDLNRELRALGIGNVVCALAGGLPGYHSLSTSLLSIRMGRPVRAIGLVVVLVVGLLLGFGGASIALLPKLVIGALLFYVGLDVLVAALVNVHLRRAWAEYAVAMLVFAAVAFVGLLEGLVAGVLAGTVLFVVSYSRVDVVLRQGSAVERHSTVVRSGHARTLLNELGDRVMILELQGYIFFGTSNLLLNRIRAHLGGAEPGHPRFVLLDFRRVTGIDSSVSLSLDKLVQYAQAYALTLIVTNLPPQLRGPFERVAPSAPPEARIRFFADLDHGLEYAENHLLLQAAGALDETIERQLHEVGGEDHEIATLMRRVERITYAEGEPLIRQGEESHDLYYIERGSVTIRLRLPDGRGVRLRTMGAGTVIGEIAVYLRLPRSATVVANRETVALRLSGDALRAMREQDPAAAALLHAFMAKQLAEKLVAATQQLAAGQG